MKEVLALLLVVFMLIPCVCVYAQDDVQTPITLCYNGDVYSVDYIFAVNEGAEISSVTVNDRGCIYDWNYVRSEARLYLSLASANAISKTKVLATVFSDAEIALTHISTVVNGNITNGVKTNHTEADMAYVAPTCDKPGHTGGKECSGCGVILEAPQEVPAAGPSVNAAISENGVLTVSGILSDDEVTEGTTLIAVYNDDKKMLALKNITALDQSDFKAEFENMKEAYTVKILRWDFARLQPIHKEIKINAAGIL